MCEFNLKYDVVKDCGEIYADINFYFKSYWNG